MSGSNNTAPVSLGEFIRVNRDELILRCKARVATIADWPSTDLAIDRGVPMFLDQLLEELGRESSQTNVIRRTAVEHGHDLFVRGFTVSQVVHDYGNVCQSVTDLAVELELAVSTEDFRTLNRCLDDAIAGAVSEHTRQQEISSNRGSQELCILVNAAITAFEVLQTGSVGVSGTTGALVHRSLLGIRSGLEASRLCLPVDNSDGVKLHGTLSPV
jgi:hypothetical protein